MAAAHNNRAEDAEAKLLRAQEAVTEREQQLAQVAQQNANLKAKCDDMRAQSAGGQELIATLREKEEQNEAGIMGCRDAC